MNECHGVTWATAVALSIHSTKSSISTCGIAPTCVMLSLKLVPDTKLVSFRTVSNSIIQF